MKGFSLWLIVLLYWSALSPVYAAGASYPAVTVPMTLKQVSDHAFYVQGLAGTAFEHEGFVSNAGAVVTSEGVVVIDALGTPSLAHRFVSLLREVTDQPIKKVIATHYHADHIYGLQVFEELGAEIIAPAGAEDYLMSEVAQQRLEERRFSLEPWVNDSTRLVDPNHYINREWRFSMGGVEFMVTPVGSAHSDADLTVYVEPDRVLFSGDIIFEGRVPFVGNANSRHWLEVLKNMEAREVAALIPGHGAAADKPNEAVGLTVRYLSYLREKMGKAVEAFIPFDEAYAAVDWSEFADLPAFEAANRRNAYQVYLAMEAESIGGD